MTKIDTITQSLEEILVEEELEKLLASEQIVKHYIGFEISGLIHLGTGLMTMRVIKSLQEKGVSTSCFLANLHAYINKKLGGNFTLITEMASIYFKEALIASGKCVGADTDKIRFVLASDIYNEDYWLSVLEVASYITISRGKRTLDIAGREGGDDSPISFLFYPAMQVADIFHQGIHLAHSGTDQRKAHVVARKVSALLTHSPLLDENGNTIKPIALHHHLIQGLLKPPVWPIPEDKRREILISMKMSKSKPQSAVFIHDTEEEIQNKIMHAFCPSKETDNNPIIDWVKHLVLPIQDKIVVERPEKYGGTVTYTNILPLVKDYENDVLHPQDLKESVVSAIITILAPARQHFEHPDRKKTLQRMKEIVITR